MTDSIDKQVLVRAAPVQLWSRLTDPQALGRWFHVGFGHGPVPGRQLRGPVLHPGYEGVIWKADVQKMEPERRMVWRWHPYAVDPKQDYSREPPTTVTFELQPTGQGTLLRLTESGFDALPPERRDEAWRMNDEGWQMVLAAIEREAGATGFGQAA